MFGFQSLELSHLMLTLSYQNLSISKPSIMTSDNRQRIDIVSTQVDDTYSNMYFASFTNVLNILNWWSPFIFEGKKVLN